MATRITRYPREVDELRARIVEALAQGLSAVEIAEREGTTPQNIYYHIRAVREVWRSRSQDYISRKKYQMVSDLEKVIEEAWAAWNLSSSPREGVVQPGKEAYLSKVVEANALLARVLGLEAPKKLAISGGRTLSSKQIQEMSTEELRSLREKILEREEGEISSTESWEGEQREGLPAGRAEVAADVSNSSNRDPESTGG